MALTRKVSHKKRPTTAVRKRSASHHKKNNHYAKAYWPYIPMLAIVTAGLLLSSGWSNSKKDVLGYATEMSASSLLGGTNSQRTIAGLGSLALNGTLSQAAQSKAQDMANKDYWSHTSPDGSTPWTFISNAGYSYQTAGENLAYGFTTSGGVISGWMNSPSHRENILKNAYTEVGFGIVNTPNYQGSGPQTIVVAMYGQPYGAPAPAPVATPAPTPPPTSTPVTVKSTPPPTATGSNTSASAGGSQQQPVEEQAPVAEPAKTEEKPVAPSTDASAKQLASMPSQDVSRVQTITATNNASWTHFALSMIASVALLVLLLRHSVAWHKLLAKGEKFVLKHPALDIAFVAMLVIGFILTRTAGIIK